MKTSHLTRRIETLEAQKRRIEVPLGPPLSADDEEFLHGMMARAFAGDRDWSDADQARYHSLLLGEHLDD